VKSEKVYLGKISGMDQVKSILTSGAALADAEKVLLMLHGRGGSSEDILSLSDHLPLKRTHIIAPRADHQTWYPYSFLHPRHENEPALSSALEFLKAILDNVLATGMESSRFYILGFSQGACLALEFAARNARSFGGVVAFTGGLIGDVIEEENYLGNFENTKVFIGNSDRDPHVPVKRSEDSAHILEKMGAEVMLKIYPGMGHTINEDEIRQVNKYIFAAS
jgi:phospholipase/carboxylesterase